MVNIVRLNKGDIWVSGYKDEVESKGEMGILGKLGWVYILAWGLTRLWVVVLFQPL